jgi:hypothetical protein
VVLRVLQLGSSYCPKLAGNGGVAAGERDERAALDEQDLAVNLR